jgi:hypothetical protein
MAVTYTNTFTDTIVDAQVSTSTRAWSYYTSWSTWTIWNDSPRTITATETIDLGGSKLLQPSAGWIGANLPTSVVIKTSSTGAFAGEETTITMAGTTKQSYTAARYWKITATWATDGNGTVPWVSNWTWNLVESFLTETFRDLDTSTLAGTAASRTVDSQLMAAVDVTLTVKKSISWVDRDYALPDSFSISTIVPVVGYVTKNPLTICLTDLYGVPVDGIVDVEIKGLTQIYQDPLTGSVTA